MLENFTSELICRMEGETTELPSEAKERVVHLFEECKKRYLSLSIVFFMFGIRTVIICFQCDVFIYNGDGCGYIDRLTEFEKLADEGHGPLYGYRQGLGGCSLVSYTD